MPPQSCHMTPEMVWTAPRVAGAEHLDAGADVGGEAALEGDDQHPAGSVADGDEVPGASRAFMTMGFSTRTSKPASMQALAWLKCRAWGVTT